MKVVFVSAYLPTREIFSPHAYYVTEVRISVYDITVFNLRTKKSFISNNTRTVLAQISGYRSQQF